MIKTGGWLRVALPAGPSYFDLKNIYHFYQKKKRHPPLEWSFASSFFMFFQRRLVIDNIVSVI